MENPITALKKIIPGGHKEETPEIPGGSLQVLEPSAVQKSHEQKNLSKILEQADKKAQNQNMMDMETTKVIIEKTLHDAYMESTTNLSRTEIKKLLILMMAYSYSRNPRLKILIVGILRMNKSITEDPTNYLKHVFGVANMTGGEDQGRWARLKSAFGGK